MGKCSNRERGGIEKIALKKMQKSELRSQSESKYRMLSESDNGECV